MNGDITATCSFTTPAPAFALTALTAGPTRHQRLTPGPATNDISHLLTLVFCPTLQTPDRRRLWLRMQRRRARRATSPRDNKGPPGYHRHRGT